MVLWCRVTYCLYVLVWIKKQLQWEASLLCVVLFPELLPTFCKGVSIIARNGNCHDNSPNSIFWLAADMRLVANCSEKYTKTTSVCNRSKTKKLGKGSMDVGVNIHIWMHMPYKSKTTTKRFWSLLQCAVEVRHHTPWPCVRCDGCWFTHSQFHSWRYSLRITLKSTTLVGMRSGYAWTQTSMTTERKWRTASNSVLQYWLIHGLTMASWSRWALAVKGDWDTQACCYRQHRVNHLKQTQERLQLLQELLRDVDPIAIWREFFPICNQEVILHCELSPSVLLPACLYWQWLPIHGVSEVGYMTVSLISSFKDVAATLIHYMIV